MTFKTKQKLDADGRKLLAIHISTIIEGKRNEELPYMPNEGDDYFWTLDLANNWKIKFFPEQPYCFEVRYRYQCSGNQFEEALGPWLIYRLGVNQVCSFCFGEDKECKKCKVTPKTDIAKVVFYNYGEVTNNDTEKKYKAVVGMVLLSDEPLSAESTNVAMGSLNISEEIRKLPRYKEPHKLGSIGDAIIAISSMSPDDLEPLTP